MLGLGPKGKRLSGNQALLLGLLGCAALVGAAVLGVQLLGTAPPPPRKPTPPAARLASNGLPRNSVNFYRNQIDEDAKRFGVQAPTVDDLAQPLPYFVELSVPREMKAQDQFETAHLKLATRVIKQWATSDAGARFRYEHLILQVTNKTDRPLAYRVQTTLARPDRCRSKGAIPHNAIAVRAGETLERSECLWHPGMTLTVQRIELVEVSPLGYFYVSRLLPKQLLLDERTSVLHDLPPKVTGCQFIPWRDIEQTAKSGGHWVDVIDFYARHNCDEYNFFASYRRRTQATELPAAEVKAVDRLPGTD